MKIWPVIRLWAFIVVFAVLLLGGIILFLPEYRRFQANERRLDEVEKTIAMKAAQLKDLQEKQRLFKTEPSYVEHVAHQLGYAYPNETVYRYEDADSRLSPVRRN